MKPGTIHWLQNRQKINLKQAMENDPIIASLRQQDDAVRDCLSSGAIECRCFLSAKDKTGCTWTQHYSMRSSIRQEIEEREKAIKLAHGILP